MTEYVKKKKNEKNVNKICSLNKQYKSVVTVFSHFNNVSCHPIFLYSIRFWWTFKCKIFMYTADAFILAFKPQAYELYKVPYPQAPPPHLSTPLGPWAQIAQGFEPREFPPGPSSQTPSAP